MKILHRFIAVIAAATLTLSCGFGDSATTREGDSSQNIGQAKYIFYFIGDGMAAAQVQLAEAALQVPQFCENYAALTGSVDRGNKLNIKELSVTGLATSNAANRYITDSAAAGTALATGSKTNVGVIGLDPEGNTLLSIAARAKQHGMKVGVVSSVSIDHATPASFYAHNESRNNYAAISDQLLTSGFDYFGGGSPRWDKRAKAEGVSNAEAFASFKQQAQSKGFKYVTTKAEFDAAKRGERVIASLDKLTNDQDTSDSGAMPYTIDLRDEKSDDNKITLAQFTQKGIDLLECEEGFFMMVEGGKIDWACHANDAAACVYEVAAFDEAVGKAIAFAAKHPTETLIVVTGDHDCGGLTLGFAGTAYETTVALLTNSKISNSRFAAAARAKIQSGESFQSLLNYACSEFGFTPAGNSDKALLPTMELSQYEVKLLREAYAKSKGRAIDNRDKYQGGYGGYDPFTTTCLHLLNNKSGLDFSSFTHTAVPVMVFASGACSDIFSGYYDNTDIAKKIAIAAGI